MEGSENRIHKLIRSAVPAAALVGVLAVAGCGGGGGGSSATAPAPVTKAPSSQNGGVVPAEGSAGLVGPAARATSKSNVFEDQQSKISPKANHKTPAQQHGVGAAEQCTNTDVMPSDTNQSDVNAAIFCLVNGERADNNLAPLAQNAQLAQAAAGMCQRMVTEHFFSHETPDGKTVVDRVQPTGYIPDNGDWVVGENLAWGDGSLSTPQAIVNGWMNSPGHRANILAPDYKDIGLAACQGAPSTTLTDGTTYVNDFGAKSGADLNATLPPESGTNSGGNSKQATAASKTAAARAATKAKKARHHHRRHRRHHRHHKTH